VNGGPSPNRSEQRLGWQTKVTRRLAHAQPSVRVRIARDMVRRIRELTRTINELQDEPAVLVKQVAPQLLTERGIGVLLAAKLIGEIGGIHRFTSDAQLARLAGCAPIPVSSGRTDRHRLDPGGYRQLNQAFYMLATPRSATTPQPPSASPNSAPTARPTKKRSAVSNATSSGASTTYSMTQPASRSPFA
jgi:transposase